MTEMPSYLIENPSFEPHKYQKQYPKRGISLFSIVFSIFTYILIFYVFNVSPSSVFNDTKILFFISNTLILIIAADYGAFTDNEKHDLFDGYTKAKRSSMFIQVHQENPRSKNEDYVVISAEDIKYRADEETTKDIECVEVPEKIIRVVSENVTIEKPHKSIDLDEKACHARKRGNPNPKPYGRSKSDKERAKQKKKDEREKRYDRSESDNSKWMLVHEKSTAEEKTMMDQKWENVLEESEEFSKMSNEELNRRVEEFIQRFNKEMKIQALRSRQILT